MSNDNSVDLEPALTEEVIFVPKKSPVIVHKATDPLVLDVMKFIDELWIMKERTEEIHRKMLENFGTGYGTDLWDLELRMGSAALSIRPHNVVRKASDGRD